MSLNLLKPIYPYKPISSIRALEAALGTSEETLRQIASNANQLYRPVKIKGGRETFDAKPELKRLHSRIKNSILSKVVFPVYLTGSLKGRDYKANASLHSGKTIVISEDVKGFFGSVKEAKVFDIWRNFFLFSEPVAFILTQLTTKDGALPQGGIPSSYLANLALWKDEPLLHAKLGACGITYSRYVDDITISSRTPLKKSQQTDILSSLYGMLRKNGLSAHRGKHKVTTSGEQMLTTKLVVNKKPSLSQQRRSATRAAVFQAEIALGNALVEEASTLLTKASGQVGHLGRFHPTQAAALKLRLMNVRKEVAGLSGEPVESISTGSLRS